MATDFQIKRFDLLPPIESTLKYADGSVINLTGATVKFIMTTQQFVSVVNAAATVVTPLAGAVSYDWAAGDTDDVGDFRAEWEITFGNGKPLTVPNGGYLTVTVTRDLG